MAQKRMNTYRAIVRVSLPGGGHFDRKIAENALNAASARKKVAQQYPKHRGYEIITVTRI